MVEPFTVVATDPATTLPPVGKALTATGAKGFVCALAMTGINNIPLLTVNNAAPIAVDDFIARRVVPPIASAASLFPARVPLAALPADTTFSPTATRALRRFEKTTR